MRPSNVPYFHNLSLILEQNQNQKKGKKKISQTNVKPLFLPLKEEDNASLNIGPRAHNQNNNPCLGSEASLKQAREKKNFQILTLKRNIY